MPFIVSAWGVGLCYIPSLVILAHYFNKRRSFATGLAACGAGIGTFTFAPIIGAMLKTYGWRGTYALIGALALNCAVCAMLYRPLKSGSYQGTVVEEGHSFSTGKEKKETTSRWHSLPAIYEADNSPTVDKTKCNINQRAYSNVELHDLRQPLPSKDKNIANPDEVNINTGPNRGLPKSDGCLTRFCSFLRERARILSNKAMVVFSASLFLVTVGSDMVFTFLPDLAVHAGFSNTDAAFLVSIAGISGTVGRAVLGWVADRPFVNKEIAFSAGLAVPVSLRNNFPPLLQELRCSCQPTVHFTAFLLVSILFCFFFYHGQLRAKS